MREFLKWLVVGWTVLAMGSCVMGGVVLDFANDTDDEIRAQVRADFIAEEEAEKGRPLTQEELENIDKAQGFVDGVGTAATFALGSMFYILVFVAWFVVAVPAVIISSLFRKDAPQNG